MNRIEQKFKALETAKKKAFVAFVTAGDPNLKTTQQLIPILESSGVDILELGVPFSDPMADGPVIQRSSERALAAGTNLKKIFNMLREVRKKSQLPILLMGYFNPIFAYGVDQFFRDAKRAGVDGALIVDLPPEEGEAARQAARHHGISLIFLLAPTSDEARIKRVSAKGSGFVYYVSMTGVTGAKLSRQVSRQNTLRKVNKISRLPVCVGFGVKTPEQARRVAESADGVVIGSALVQILEKYSGPVAIRRLSTFAGRLAKAIHSI